MDKIDNRLQILMAEKEKIKEIYLEALCWNAKIKRMLIDVKALEQELSAINKQIRNLNKQQTKQSANNLNIVVKKLLNDIKNLAHFVNNGKKTVYEKRDE